MVTQYTQYPESGSVPVFLDRNRNPGYDVVPANLSCAGEAVLYRPSIVASNRSATALASPIAVNNKRANRVSLITSRSLFDIHEPGLEIEHQYQQYERDHLQPYGSALGLDIQGQAYEIDTYDPRRPRSITVVSPTESLGVPSLTHSAQTSSTGHSTACPTPIARPSYLSEQPERLCLPETDVGLTKKEKKVGKALLSKLKSFLLAPQSPTSARKDIKRQSRSTRLRRKKNATPPTVEARSTSLYRTVDVPDPLRLDTDFHGSSNRRASVICHGPYGNLAAYQHGAFESTASFASPIVTRTAYGYASVADFRHYSTAELPLDPTVPYSPYAARESRRHSTLIDTLDTAYDDIAHQPARGSDLELGTDKVKLKVKHTSGHWVGRSKQFWSSALDLTLPRTRSTMSTVDLVSPQPIKPSTGLVPAPPIPARSRLRGTPSSLNLAGTATRDGSANTTPTARTPAPQLPSSPSDSSIGSSSSGSASASLPAVGSPGVPVTPRTPPAHGRKQSGGWKFGSVSKAGRNGDVVSSGPYSPDGNGQITFGEHVSGSGSSEWPGKLEGAQSPASQKRSRFSRASRHSSSGSVSLSAASDPMRVKDGVAPRHSASGIYTPPTYPGPSPRPSYSHQSSYASTTTLPRTASRSASGSSDASTAYSTSGSSFMSIPQTPTSHISPSSAAASASKMYNACMGALSGWSISSGSGKRASHQPKPSAPYSPVHVDAGPMSANAAYFPAPPVHKPLHQASRSVSHSYSHGQDHGTVQIWSPAEGWIDGGRAAGLGVGVEEEGNYVQGRSRGNSVATQMILVGDAPKGRRKPVPKAQEEVHAL